MDGVSTAAVKCSCHVNWLELFLSYSDGAETRIGSSKGLLQAPNLFGDVMRGGAHLQFTRLLTRLECLLRSLSIGHALPDIVTHRRPKEEMKILLLASSSKLNPFALRWDSIYNNK